jgi:hypothetical protein
MTQRTDKELLELAARTAGLNVKAIQVDCDDELSGLIVGAKNTREKILWNPITDDGDALRLAVKLNALVDINNGKTACVLLGPETGSVNHGSDPYAATRRAIVRAAADIGAKL